MTSKEVVRAVLIVAGALVAGYLLLYTYRSQTPDGASPMMGVAGAFTAVLPLVLLVALTLLAARTMARARLGERYEALARIADLRDRGVLSEDEFQKEKRRIVG